MVNSFLNTKRGEEWLHQAMYKNAESIKRLCIINDDQNHSFDAVSHELFCELLEYRGCSKFMLQRILLTKILHECVTW